MEIRRSELTLGDALVRMIQHVAKEAALKAVRDTLRDAAHPGTRTGLQMVEDAKRKTSERPRAPAVTGSPLLLSPAEVARRLGVTKEAVYNRQHRLKLRGKGKHGTAMKLADVVAWEKERAARPNKGKRVDSPVTFNGLDLGDGG